MRFEQLFSDATDGNRPFPFQVRFATGPSPPKLVKVPTGLGRRRWRCWAGCGGSAGSVFGGGFHVLDAGGGFGDGLAVVPQTLDVQLDGLAHQPGLASDAVNRRARWVKWWVGKAWKTLK